LIKFIDKFTYKLQQFPNSYNSSSG